MASQHPSARTISVEDYRELLARRLRAAGLGDFCLEAHGHGGDKATVKP